MAHNDNYLLDTDGTDVNDEVLAENRAAVVSPANARRDAAASSKDAPRHAVKDRAARQFDNWAHSYDRSIVQHLLFQPSYQLFLQELYRWRKDNTEPFDLLDIGCGTGTWTAMVAGSEMNSRLVTGLDYARTMCEVAHTKAETIGAGAPQFLQGDSEHLPFADGSFDAVTCSNSFHHYPHQQATIHEMRRVLRPGGRLMLIDGFRDNVIGWTLFDVFITRAESTPEAKVYHAPWSELREMFEAAGFRKVSQRKQGVWVPIMITIGVV